jgi:hypothetical protein
VERQSLLTAAQAVLSKPIDLQVFKDRVDRYAKEGASPS